MISGVFLSLCVCARVSPLFHLLVLRFCFSLICYLEAKGRLSYQEARRKVRDRFDCRINEEK